MSRDQDLKSQELHYITGYIHKIYAVSTGYWLRFYVPLNTKWGISEMFPQASLLAWYGKTKHNTTKAHIHQSKEMYNYTK